MNRPGRAARSAAHGQRRPAPKATIPGGWRWLLAAGGLIALAAVGAEPPATAPPIPTPTPSPPPTPPGDAVDPGPTAAEVQSTVDCTLPAHPVPGIEWARQTSFRGVCLTAHWLDGLFGVEPYDPVVGIVTGQFSLELEQRQGDGLTVLPKVRANVSLPNVSKKIDLFFDRDRESSSIAGESPALHPPRGTPDTALSNQVGVGYRVYRTLDAMLNLRVGLRFHNRRPDLFVRNTYHVDFAVTAKHRWIYDQTVYWTHQQGYGETSQIDYERHLGGPYLFRWGNSATIAEVTDRIRWRSAVSVFQVLDHDRVLQYSWGGNGETGQAEPLAAHGPRVGLRQRLGRRWLIVEAYAGIDYLKDENTPVRHPQQYLGVKVEAHFSPL